MAVEVLSAHSPHHFREAARLHADGITEGFLSTLGQPFLTSLYQGIGESAGAGVFVAVEGGTVLGFISYARDVGSCYRQTLRRRFFPMTGALLRQLIKPRVLGSVLETLAYPLLHRGREQTATDDRPAPTVRSELLSMAVSAQARGKGVGKLLVRAVDQALQAEGVGGYFVVTHAVDERSNGFYRSCGFSPTREYRSHGKPMNEYFKTFD